MMKLRFYLVSTILSLLCWWGMTANAKPTKAILVEDDKGWKLTVDGKDFFIKGLTWSTTPIGFKYDYDLFKESDQHIKDALERDFSLMRAMGVNTVRGAIPPKWAKYAYEKYGMHTVPNYFCGRYGMTINGKWVSPVDYSNPDVRKAIIAEAVKTANTYKDVEGVIAYAFGNENNYGLEWKSAEIEDLPQGERHKAKAKYLYSLFEEVFRAVKKVDPNRPVGLVNGDLQYIDLIKQECKSLDFFGTNSYRGRSTGPLFRNVKEKLGKPVLFMEIGCDAFNAVTQTEDQDSQASFYRDQWKDLYLHAYGNGLEGNCIGGMIFQWADEWWKKGQQVELEKHNREASWSHGAFYDAAAGKNMNEEWFGICSIHRTKINGVHQISPRVAYFVMKKLWSKSPINMGPGAIESHFATVQVPEVEFEPTAAKTEGATGGGPVGQRIKGFPFVLYGNDGDKLPYIPAGFMGNTGAIKQDMKCTTNPQSGTTCVKVTYGDSSGWGGVVWQSPANDWGDQPGGFDLNGAEKLTFWARGEQGGEKVKFELGLIGKDKPYHDTASSSAGEVVLTKDWKQYSMPLKGRNLNCIKTGFAWVVAGSGRPIVFYLDSMKVEGKAYTGGKAQSAVTTQAVGKKANLPFVLYAEAGQNMPYVPSGYMGNTGAIKVRQDATTQPQSGSTCMEVSYTAPDQWAGVVWQSPHNDWGDQPGGFDLSGAKKLSFWARGAQGGEKLKVEFGLIGRDKPYYDTGKGGSGDLVLTTQWQQFTIPLTGKNLKRIKTGFCWVLAGQGKPITFYLDDIKYE